MNGDNGYIQFNCSKQDRNLGGMAAGKVALIGRKELGRERDKGRQPKQRGEGLDGGDHDVLRGVVESHRGQRQVGRREEGGPDTDSEHVDRDVVELVCHED